VTPLSASSVASLVRPFLPPAAVLHVEPVLAAYPLEVRIARPRRTKLGDHRPPAAPARPHRISINSDLNPYAFLTTLLHEVAHAATWERHGPRRRRTRPHGVEWKREFEAILAPVVAASVLPDDVAKALARSMRNPAAATCSDRELVLALARYDPTPVNRMRVEDLAEGAFFRVDNGHAFRAGRQVRTRRQCYEWGSGREYRVHGLLLVEPLEAADMVRFEGPSRPRRPRRRRIRWRRA
jgi:SprT protein